MRWRWLRSLLNSTEQTVTIVRRVSDRVAPPSGAVYRHLRQGGQATGPVACALLHNAYFANETAANHSRLKDCLLDLPDFGTGATFKHASLATVYIEEYEEGFNRELGPALERANAAVKRALSIAPDNSRPLRQLARIQLLQGNANLALETGERMLRADPYDVLSLATHAGNLITQGQYARGVELMEQARAARPVHAPYWDFALFVGYGGLGNYEAAIRNALLLTNLSNPLSTLARAIAAHLLGRSHEAQFELANLVRLEPAVRDDPAVLFKRRHYHPDVSARLIAELKAAGLDRMPTATHPAP